MLASSYTCNKSCNRENSCLPEAGTILSISPTRSPLIPATILVWGSALISTYQMRKQRQKRLKKPRQTWPSPVMESWLQGTEMLTGWNQNSLECIGLLRRGWPDQAGEEHGSPLPFLPVSTLERTSPLQGAISFGIRLLLFLFLHHKLAIERHGRHSKSWCWSQFKVGSKGIEKWEHVAHFPLPPISTVVPIPCREKDKKSVCINKYAL